MKLKSHKQLLGGGSAIRRQPVAALLIVDTAVQAEAHRQQLADVCAVVLHQQQLGVLNDGGCRAAE
jgi:hypothetical protein